MTLHHRNGGTIETIHAIEHDTYKGVASWEFRGRVKWQDGTISESAHIAPYHLAAQGENQAEADELLAAMQAYLDREGRWHNAKTASDGRIYHWTPREKKHSEPYTWPKEKTDADH